jgi:hypothetical protein
MLSPYSQFYYQKSRIRVSIYIRTLHIKMFRHVYFERFLITVDFCINFNLSRYKECISTYKTITIG